MLSHSSFQREDYPMQATLRFSVQVPQRDATATTRVLGRLSSENHLKSRAPETIFRLTVRCAQSLEEIAPLLREALADNLIDLSQRVRTTAAGQALCTFEAIVRSVRVSRCQVVALIAQLQRAGVRDVWWESVQDQEFRGQAHFFKY